MTTPDPQTPVDEPDAPGVRASREEHELVLALRRGEEAAFRALLAAHDAMLRRLAGRLVSTGASADEVVQETWTAVIEGIASFQGRSSLKTWVTSILLNKAKSRAARDGRSMPFSAALRDDDADTPAVDPSRFNHRGKWQAPPEKWDADTPEELLGRREVSAILARALEEMPERQRLIVILRDVEGWTSDEVCNVLGLRETNQRVLLHRARSRLRALVEDELQGTSA
jgi:RNA polymerase sigma-70 factor (ECF subfamily)